MRYRKAANKSKVVPTNTINNVEADFVAMVVAALTSSSNTGMGRGVGGGGRGTIHLPVSGSNTLPIWHSHWYNLSVSVEISTHFAKSWHSIPSQELKQEAYIDREVTILGSVCQKMTCFDRRILFENHATICGNALWLMILRGSVIESQKSCDSTSFHMSKILIS